MTKRRRLTEMERERLGELRRRLNHVAVLIEIALDHGDVGRALEALIAFLTLYPAVVTLRAGLRDA